MRQFEAELVKSGKAEAKFLHVLNELIKVSKNFKKGKYSKNYIEDIRKNARSAYIEKISAVLQSS